MKTYSSKSNAKRAALKQFDNEEMFTMVKAEDGRWGFEEVKAEPVQPEPVAPKTTGKGLKIQKNREERNGIKRPSVGGKCAAVWEQCEAHHEETGMIPTPKALKTWAEENGHNFNNVSIELYRWRNFMGYKGR